MVRISIEFGLTADWYTLSLSIRVENCDVHIGGQVPPLKMGDKICIPANHVVMSIPDLRR